MRRWVTTLSLTLLAACAPEPLTLAVDLRTDFVPGMEFTAVVTELEAVEVGEVPAERGDRAFLDGIRVAELRAVPSGTHHVRVSVRDANGGSLAERPVIVDLDTSTAVTVVMTRDCFGVVCPPPEDPELVSCFGGTCADPRCLYGEAGCPVECEVASDCAALTACTRARCEVGVCFYDRDDSDCAVGEQCSPDCGCIPPPPTRLTDPASYCGRCGVDCTQAAHATMACVEGACAVSSCETGYRDCDGDPSNGCESMPSWTPTGGGDHCGDDWVVDGDELVGGVHVNVGRFEVGGTATLAAFDGTSGGTLRVQAEEIVIAGVLDASGRGALGGNGGSGAASGRPHYCGSEGSGGAPGQGSFAGAGGGAGTGHGGDDSADDGCRYARGRDGEEGSDGGYAAPGANGDTSEDDEVWLGSGGGGGGGGGSGSRFGSNNNFPAGTGGGGGAGGRGGGSIVLEAAGTLSVGGRILARGDTSGGDGAAGSDFSGCERYQDPGGGQGGGAGSQGTSAPGSGACQRFSSCGGGTSDTCGGAGGAGGGGAGGGVLLRGRTISVSGTIDLRGGRDSMSNAGTLKVRHGCGSPGTFPLVGRLHVLASEPCP